MSFFQGIERSLLCTAVSGTDTRSASTLTHQRATSSSGSTKFSDNVARDRRTTAALKRLGWRVITVWECELGCPDKLRSRLTRLLAASAARQTRSRAT